MSKIDLWGEIPEIDQTAPAEILNEQAKLLEEKTDYSLTASVQTQPFLTDQFRTTLAVASSSLDYKFDLVSVYYTFDLLILPRKDGHRQATSLVECCSNAAGVA